MDDGGWVVLRTLPRSELLAARVAAEWGLEAYIPLVPGQPAGRSSLLFPGYLFARVSAASDDLVWIRSAPGVAYPLRRGEPPTLLSDGLVNLVRRRLTDPSTTALRSLRAPGDRLSVIDGQVLWMEAVFDRRLKAAGRLGILCELAHRTLNMEKPRSEGQAAGLFLVWRG